MTISKFAQRTKFLTWCVYLEFSNLLKLFMWCAFHIILLLYYLLLLLHWNLMQYTHDGAAAAAWHTIFQLVNNKSVSRSNRCDTEQQQRKNKQKSLERQGNRILYVHSLYFKLAFTTFQFFFLLFLLLFYSITYCSLSA